MEEQARRAKKQKDKTAENSKMQQACVLSWLLHAYAVSAVIVLVASVRLVPMGPAGRRDWPGC